MPLENDLPSELVGSEEYDRMEAHENTDYLKPGEHYETSSLKGRVTYTREADEDQYALDYSIPKPSDNHSKRSRCFLLRVYDVFARGILWACASPLY
jgi:hypothetical protein